MKKYELGTVEASEQLIRDLYINLRHEVNEWSKITNQTPQARMGYVGQHLVSVVTGFPGGKSGARGYDLVMNDGEYGEIKTCYRVDQLGQCNDCGSVVSSLEKTCSGCGSDNIDRKDDSKWLIAIQHEQEFSEIINPSRYYFVLFEFEDIKDKDNDTIVASIWEVDPKGKGFFYCMIDYYINIRANSKSKAPFNMWPYQLKFALTNPMLIYRSYIYSSGDIKTCIFPSLHNSYIDELRPLYEYSSATTLTVENISIVIKGLRPDAPLHGGKKELLITLERIRNEMKIKNNDLCERISDAIYLPLIENQTDKFPPNILEHYNNI